MRAGKTVPAADGPYTDPVGSRRRSSAVWSAYSSSQPHRCPMSTDRRAILAGLAGLPFAAASAGAVSARALVGSADPFIGYHGWILALHAAINAGPGEAEAVMDALGDIDREAMAGRPTTLAGAAGALQMARRESVQFRTFDEEDTADTTNRLILHLLDGAMGVLGQAVEGGARG